MNSKGRFYVTPPCRDPVLTQLYRVLYRLLTKELEPGKVGLAPPPWLSRVRVVSLTFVEWSVDDRRRDDRLNDPRLVDVGWTDTSFPSFFEQFTGSTVHLKLKSLVKMINPGSKVTCVPLNAPRPRLDP